MFPGSTCGQTGTMTGAWKARLRLLDSLCLARWVFMVRNSCTILSSLLQLGVSDVCTRKCRTLPSLP